MAKKKKYYVVWEGKKTGILESWSECQKSIYGFEGAKFKSFKTLETAKKAFSEKYENYKGKNVFETELSKEVLALIGKPNLETISVDAACSGNPGIMEYQGVDTNTKEVIFKQGPFLDTTNNVGEFLALVHGLAHLKKVNDKRPIYSDSRIAINWVKKHKKSRSKIERTKRNEKIFELIERANNWLKTNNFETEIIKWETKAWGEIPADFGRK